MAPPDAYTPRLINQLQGYTSIVAGHVEAAPGVAYMELARPHRHNSFHEELWDEFPRALQQLDAHQDTRVIVVAAQGKNFCAGIDVGYLQRNFAAMTSSSAPATAATSPAVASTATAGESAAAAAAATSGRAEPCPGAQRAAMRRNILYLQDAYSELERCRAPVIAAVQGRCIGGGVDLITACDIRICSQDASFCVKEVDLAIAADLGTLQRLPHVVGHGVAIDLALTARTVDAAEARHIGLVSTVVPFTADVAASTGNDSPGRVAVVAAALQLARVIASKPQLAVQGTKRVLLHARDQPRVADGLDYVATWNSAQLITHDLTTRILLGGTVNVIPRQLRRQACSPTRQSSMGSCSTWETRSGSSTTPDSPTR
ncbi:hypothetical protein VOLCADRAFT_80880 [Volvox carteri f. nagariensis]|uniref:Uncharacterized protein n=1 Tax=Volvox carteri f. nagariensis TaxID=3068 RepID=D8TUB4_VOLCA|nr:uncharacterized protein VOLCADRAFT_80880 [Volvox carteri f. nagariensis]EFJ49010.1 hypothetical protein VOLCADRAFT_80880 [Volvox carteri f. nagariensis]|eukprot:XP_002949907.1 hypothetical protein VOLCADRAFT_80880 [Volvox carteri f. nagariensis]